MTYRLRILAVISLALPALLYFSSCKENTLVDTNPLPAGDNVHITGFPDTLPVISRSVYDDSIITSLRNAPVYGGAGTVNDPFFGRTSAGFYLQIVPAQVPYSFPSRPDSAVLILPYGGFAWGDTTSGNAPQRFSVYRLTENMSISRDYYSAERLSIDRSEPLGVAEGITIDQISGTDRPHLRIKLSSRFLSMMQEEAPDTMKNRGEFLTYFHGLYIEPDTTSTSANTLYYFRLDAASEGNAARVAFYTGDSVVTAFSYNSEFCAKFTTVSRAYSTRAASYFNSPAGRDTVLLQNEPGAATDVIISRISEIPRGMINKAELVLTLLDDPDMNKYAAPARIYPIGVDPSGSYYNIADRLPLSSTAPLQFIDGNMRVESKNGRIYYRYSVNFPRELQQAILTGKEELHLRINGTQVFPGAYRMLAGGRNHPDPEFRMKLNIVYSSIEN